MATTFEKFSSLPAELRLDIWEHALRPAGLGVHFFTVEVGNKSVQGKPGVGYGLTNKTKVSFAAPRIGYRRSWVDGNLSAYLIDAGLWTACKESRRVMEKAFGTKLWGQKRLNLRLNGRAWDTLPLPESEGAPGTGRFQHRNEDWSFAVFPHRDLFCFQFSGETQPAIFYSNNFTFCTTRLSFSGIRKVAFEFDDDWAFDYGNKTINDLLRNQAHPRGHFLRLLNYRLDGAHDCPELFLIEHRVRLRPGAQRHKVFHGNDRVLVDFVFEDEVAPESDFFAATTFIEHLRICVAWDPRSSSRWRRAS